MVDLTLTSSFLWDVLRQDSVRVGRVGKMTLGGGQYLSLGVSSQPHLKGNVRFRLP